jgi:transcriptional regulator of heat shock response
LSKSLPENHLQNNTEYVFLVFVTEKGNMQKKLLMGAALSALLLTQAPVAHALTGTEAAKMRQENRQERQEVRQENQEARQEVRQERRDTRLENIANRVEQRFANHKKQLENWITRATSRIATMESKGKNVTAAKASLETVKTSLATASALGDDAVAKLRAVQPEAWSAQKADAVAAREAVKKAQVAYAQVVKNMQLTIKEMRVAAK